MTSFRSLSVTFLAAWLAAAGPIAAQTLQQLKPRGTLSALPARGPASPPPAKPDAAAPRVDLAFGAYQRGYYLTALRDAMKRINADPNDGAAMTLIGVLYRDGLGVPQNLAEAARWFRLGSEHGDLQATFALGVAYLRGVGVAKNQTKAKALFEKAAARNHAGALYNLGIMALDSDKPDFAKAVGYFRRSAKGGDMDAVFSLAEFYQKGTGVPKNMKKAARLLHEAADEGNVAAEVEYGIALFNGEGVAKDEAGAAKYFLRAAGKNNPIAEDRIARMLAAGRGIKKNIVEAMKWYILARAAGIKDPWLAAQLNNLSPQDKLAVVAAVRRYVAY